MAGNNKVILIQKFNQSKNSDKIILISPFGLGDTMNLCGYKKALEKHYNAPVHFVIKPTHEIVMKIYGIEDYSIQVFDKPELKAFAKKNAKVKVGEYFVAHPNFLNDDNKTIKEFIDLKVSFIEVFRKTLGLPDDAKFEYPTIKPILSEDTKKKIEKFASLEKIALFSPEAFSTNKIVPEVLEDEVKRLVTEGYTVISNVINKKLTIKGSIYVPLTIEEAFALAVNCGKVISVRSGFTDIIVPFIKETTIYYPNLETFKLYNLGYLKNKKIKEIIAPDSQLRKIGPCFQIEDKNDEKLFRFCITLFRVKERRERTKYCIFGIQIWVIKNLKNCRKHLLFGITPIYKEKL